MTHSNHDASRSLNPDLRELEADLRGIALPVAPRQADQLMYACGQAAAQAGIRNRSRVQRSGLAAILLVTLGLGGVAGRWTVGEPQVASSPTAFEDAGPTLEAPTATFDERPGDIAPSPRQQAPDLSRFPDNDLYVGMPLDRLAMLDTNETELVEPDGVSAADRILRPLDAARFLQ